MTHLFQKVKIKYIILSESYKIYGKNIHIHGDRSFKKSIYDVHNIMRMNIIRIRIVSTRIYFRVIIQYYCIFIKSIK